MGTVTTTTFVPSASVVVLERCRNFGEKPAKNKNKSLKSCKFCCICGTDVSHRMDPTMTTAQFGTFVRNILVPSCSSGFPSSSQLTTSLTQSKWICRICLDSLEQVEFLTGEMTKLEQALKQVLDLLRLKMAKHSGAREPVEVVNVDNPVGPIIFSGDPILPEDEIKEEEEDFDMDADEVEEDVKPIIVEECDDMDLNEDVEPDSPSQDAIDQLDGQDQTRIPSSPEEPNPPADNESINDQDLNDDGIKRPVSSISPRHDDMEVDNHPERENNKQLNTTPTHKVPEASTSSSSPLIRSTRQSKLRAQQVIRSLHKKEKDENEDDNVSCSDNEDDDDYASSNKSGKSSSDDENNCSESDNDSDKNDTENGNDFPCDVCGNVYQSRRSVNRHRRRVHKIKKSIPIIIGPRFHCSICDKGYLTRDGLQQHHRNTHTITTNKIRDEHFRRIIGPLFHCSICDKGFSRLDYLNQHRKTMHKMTESSIDKQGPFICDVCQREFTNLSNLGCHKRKLHDAPPKTLPLPKLPCDICKAYLSDKRALSQHKLRIHDKVFPFSCKECDWKFMTPFLLKRHVAKHHGPGPAPMIRVRKENHYCDTCNIGYSFKKSLFAHIKRVHNADKTLKCDRPRCNKTFYSQARLDEHYEHFHPKEEGVDPKVCGFCKEKFLNIRAKIDHMGRAHKKADEEKMSCSYCNGMEFTSKVSFKNHMKRHNEGDERPYLCPNCGRGFASEAAHGTHMKIVCNRDEEAKERNRRRRTELQAKYRARVKNKSIKCGFCGTGFLGQRKLNFHIAKFHKDEKVQQEGGESASGGSESD